MIVTGTKTHYGYRMSAPHFPYTNTTYIGYTLAQLKRKYREDYGLKGKHIEWIIL